jgi:putative hydrolase of the HAD superfamily
VRAVLLDLDDTLIEEEGFARAQLRATADLVDGAAPALDKDTWDQVVIDSARTLWRGSTFYPDFLELGFASWEGLWATFDGVHRRVDGVASWAVSYRRQAWRAALEAGGLGAREADMLADALSARYIEGQRSGHPVLPGAIDLLDRLAATGLPLAIVTNGPPDIQRLKIEQAGIAPYFSAVVISGEIGIGKPDPAVFGHALELLDVSPEHAVMVGDSWERDVTGALASGVRPIWISHGRPVPDPDPRVSVVRGPRDVTW